MANRAFEVLTRCGMGVLVLAAISGSACGAHEVAVEYREFEYTFSQAERRTIQRIADATAIEVRKLLPELAAPLVLRVGVDDDVSDITGASGTFDMPDTIYWTVDPDRGGGVAAIAETHLRPTLFHELHHLVREVKITRASLMDHVISEGMASAFERDFAGAAYPWTEYPENVSSWVAELMAVPTTADTGQWMFRHPDGRRWIGYRAGTYLVDRAISTSGKSVAELATTSTQDIVRLARTERQ